MNAPKWAAVAVLIWGLGGSAWAISAEIIAAGLTLLWENSKKLAGLLEDAKSAAKAGK